jgi:hypothetical protein
MSKPNADQLRDVIRTMPAPLPPGERRRYTVSDLQVGGFFEYKGQTYRVQSMNPWNVEDSISTELEALNLTTGDTVYFEWWREPDLHLLISATKIEPRDLGLRPGHVEEVDTVKHGGRTFYYDSDYEAAYGDAKRRVQVRLYEADDDWKIYVQKWPDGYTAWLSQEVEPGSVEVLVVGQSA